MLLHSLAGFVLCKHVGQRNDLEEMSSVIQPFREVTESKMVWYLLSSCCQGFFPSAGRTIAVALALHLSGGQLRSVCIRKKSHHSKTVYNIRVSGMCSCPGTLRDNFSWEKVGRKYEMRKFNSYLFPRKAWL